MKMVSSVLEASTEHSILGGSARANLLNWESKKIHRVVNSTLAAETAAMSFEFERSIFARAVFSEINAGRSTAWQMMSKDIPLASSSRTTLDIFQATISLSAWRPTASCCSTCATVRRVRLS